MLEALKLLGFLFPLAFGQVIYVPPHPSQLPEAVFDNSGNPWPFTSQINAENYDTGIGAFSSTVQGCGGGFNTSYRADYTNLKSTASSTGTLGSPAPAFQVACIINGDYYRWTVSVPATNTYTVTTADAQADATSAGQWQVSFLQGGLNQASTTIPIPSTGAYTTFSVGTSSPVALVAGIYEMQLTCSNAGGTTYCGDLAYVTGTAACTGVAVTAASGIQNAVNANPAGTTFCLAAGTYNEAVVPKSNDTFQGANIGQTILDGNNSLGSAFASSGSAITGVTIKQLTVRHYTGFAAIYPSCCSGATGWLIDTVEVNNNTQEGFDIAPNTTIRNSLIHDNGLNGIHDVSSGSDNIVISNNDIYSNNATKTNPCGTTADTAGEKLNGTKTVSFTNNRVHNNYGNGLWFDGEADTLTVAFNEFYGNATDSTNGFCGSSGVEDEIGNPHAAYGTNLIHDNYFHDNGGNRVGGNPPQGANIWITNSGSWDIYNNAIVVTTSGSNVNTGIMYLDEGARTDSAGCGVNGTLCIVQYVRFHDNFLATAGDTLFAGQDGATTTADWAHNNNTWTNNTYYLPSSSSAVFLCVQSNSSVCAAHFTTWTFAQWQAASMTPDVGSTVNYNGTGALPANVGPRGSFVCNANMGTAAGSLGVCP